MAGIEGDNLWSLQFLGTTISVLNMDLAACQEPHVCVHAELGADDRLHVSGPPESGRVNHALDPAGASPHDVELKTADGAVLRSLYSREKRVGRIHVNILRTEA